MGFGSLGFGEAGYGSTHYALAAEAAAIAVSPGSVAFRRTYRLAATPASIVVTPAAAALQTQRRLPAAAATLSCAPLESQLRAARRMPAAAGQYVISTSDSTRIYLGLTVQLPSLAMALVLTPGDVRIAYSVRLTGQTLQLGLGTATLYGWVVDLWPPAKWVNVGDGPPGQWADIAPPKDVNWQ